jgi:hypothetical protein
MPALCASLCFCHHADEKFIVLDILHAWRPSHTLRVAWGMRKDHAALASTSSAHDEGTRGKRNRGSGACASDGDSQGRHPSGWCQAHNKPNPCVMCSVICDLFVWSQCFCYLFNCHLWVMCSVICLFEVLLSLGFSWLVSLKFFDFLTTLMLIKNEIWRKLYSLHCADRAWAWH